MLPWIILNASVLLPQKIMLYYKCSIEKLPKWKNQISLWGQNIFFVLKIRIVPKNTCISWKCFKNVSIIIWFPLWYQDHQKFQNIGYWQQVPKQMSLSGEEKPSSKWQWCSLVQEISIKDMRCGKSCCHPMPEHPSWLKPFSYLHGTVESANRVLTTNVFIFLIYSPLLPDANIIHQLLDSHGMRTWNMHWVPV